jgi:SAM-dependent methyltransferase
MIEMAVAVRRYARDDLGMLNQKAFQRRGVLRRFGSASGWLERGEQIAVLSVAEAVRGAPILDIGVGGGRTAPLMREISTDYRGIDFAPKMIATARARFPTLDFRKMDARHLEFGDGSFALATFSYNGIDAVDLEGRRAVMREVHRVLRPGGYFVFSALNRNGSEWLPRWPNWEVFQGAGLRPLRLLRATAKLLLSGFNRLRWSGTGSDGAEASIGSLAVHNFSLVTMFTSPLGTLRQIQEAGFKVEAMYDPDGAELPLEDKKNSSAPWYHVVARKDERSSAVTGQPSPLHAVKTRILPSVSTN